MPKIPITLTFFEPYRLIEWCDEARRKTNARYLRGQSFAQYRQKADGSLERLQIAGTLLRSAVIRAAEELLCLRNNKPKNNGYGRCCQGKFKTVTDKKPFLYRKRPTLIKLQQSERPVCDPEKQPKEEACALCLLLGRFDKAGKDRGSKSDYDIHFNNLNLIRNGRSIKLSDIATERGFNRVNYHTGKARDYFKVWEVDDEDYWTFQGVITVNEQEKTDEQLKQMEQLLMDSLGFVDKLCGAICRIALPQKGSNHEEHEATKKNLQITPKDVRKEPAIGLSEEIRNYLRESAKDIVDAFDESDKIEKARTLADVVRAMRLEEPDSIGKLPKGRGGKAHHLWDVKVAVTPIRQVLEELWKAVNIPRHPSIAGKDKQEHTPSPSQEGNRESPLLGGDLGVGGLPRENHDTHNTWRSFCETLGNGIYREYKEKTGGFSPQLGILGEAVEYHASPGSADTQDICITLASGNTVTTEWIIVGNLKAITPFFFGTESGENDQTSYRILLNKKNQYRIPRSLMRGVLRRDLRTAFDTGCNAEPGGMLPCNCPVCIIMRRVTIMDSLSKYTEPPDIRYRIRMNPQTATVDEGALFDMEVGPEGITFPFVLRYRGEGEFPAELRSVIHYWMDDMAWLGGSGSTGKGRFALEEDVKVYTWELSGEGLNKYIEKGGLRGDIEKVKKELEELEENVDKLPGFDEEKDVAILLQTGTLKGYEPYQKYLQPQWEEVAYTLTINSPLLTADTISALLDPENRDSIAYRKRVWDAEKKEHALKFTIKGETIRGIVRTAVGKKQGILGAEHKDCDCESCMTFINIFGNEHEAGKIRFEDLEVTIKNGELETAPNCKKIDHVAIDRFTGGAVDKKKFDTYPIAGSPNNPILLKGTFWMKRDLTDKEKELIGDALLDIKQGLYPIGGKTGIGYGWVSHVFKLEETKMSEISTGEPYKFSDEPPLLPDDKDKVYYPHYFLKPDACVDNKLKQIGHEKFDKNLLTGKIGCSLKTLTPLIIPDTENEDALGLQKDHPGHKNFKFFHINNDVMIPGSEIRGTISSVYEALTNSCFRILDEKKYISWRMKPEEFAGNRKQDIEGFKPGAIKKDKDNGQLKVIEVESYRLPLYDDQSKTKTIDLATFKSMVTVSEKKLENAVKVNNEIASAAMENIHYLRNLSEQDRKEVLSGKKEVTFEDRPINFVKKKDGKEICIDKIAILTNDSKKGLKKGFIKFTGPNNANISIVKGKEDCGFGDTWNIWDLNILLGNIPATADKFRVSNKQYYPRPYLTFIKNEAEYSISKRCERIFLQPDTKNGYSISIKICNQYKDILKEYREYREKVDDDVRENFCTNIINEELADKDLVYFHLNDRGEVDAIIPVCISRKSASKTIGEKIPDNLCPCESGIAKGRDIAPDTGARFSSAQPDGLCPACRLFGTTDYKGRVRFGFAKPQDNNSLMLYNNGQPLTLPLLESPRPTWSMPDDTYNVPGRKFYVHHNRWKDVKDKGESKNNCSVEAIDKGNEFQFEIFFENLEAWELGLLLYTLELEPKLAHKMGKAKAFGFGSVQIRVDNILLRGSPDDKNNKKNWLDAGFNQLKTWFDKTSLNTVTHIHNLRWLLRFPDDGQSHRVQYPELKKEKEGDLPGYVELGKKEKWRFEDRIECLTTPWSPWHPYVTPKGDKQESAQKAKVTITPDKSPAHKKDQRDPIAKSKNPPANKHSGTVKWFNEKKGYGFIIKDSDGDVFVHISAINDGIILKEGQRVVFDVVPSARGLNACNVTVVNL